MNAAHQDVATRMSVGRTAKSFAGIGAATSPIAEAKRSATSAWRRPDESQYYPGFKKTVSHS